MSWAGAPLASSGSKTDWELSLLSFRLIKKRKRFSLFLRSRMQQTKKKGNKLTNDLFHCKLQHWLVQLNTKLCTVFKDEPHHEILTLTFSQWKAVYYTSLYKQCTANRYLLLVFCPASCALSSSSSSTSRLRFALSTLSTVSREQGSARALHPGDGSVSLGFSWSKLQTYYTGSYTKHSVKYKTPE